MAGVQTVAGVVPNFATADGSSIREEVLSASLAWFAASERPAFDAGAEAGKPNEDWVCILNALPAGLLLLNGSGEVVFANETAKALLAPDVEGQLWRDLILKLFDPRMDDGHDISTRKGRRVSISTRPLPSGFGQLLLFSDVTETRQLQERIARRERLSDVGQMAAGLVHQIRSPVAAAMLYASQLASATVPADMHREFATKLLARLHELESLVRELLVFARGGGLIMESVAIAELLDELPRSLAPQLQSSNVTLDVQNLAASVSVRCNREAILSALQNPVLNALQAGAQQVIVKAATSSQGWVDLWVLDDGAGIPAADIGRVFEPFYTTKNTGTGLGLAMVKLVAEAHGGRVWAERAHGRGTAIRFRLPTESDASSRLSRLDCVSGGGECS